MKLYDISLTLSPRSIRWVTSQPLELIERKRMSCGDTNHSSSVHASALVASVFGLAATGSIDCAWNGFKNAFKNGIFLNARRK